MSFARRATTQVTRKALTATTNVSPWSTVCHTRVLGYTRSSFSTATATSSPKAGEAVPIEGGTKFKTMLFDGEEEILSREEQAEKDMLIKELKRRLSGPLADESGVVPTGNDRPIAIEVDGPSHFYANSQRYTAYTKLKHRLLSRMGYKVLHVPYFEWRKLRGAAERQEYMKNKLIEEPTEWLDPEDEKYYYSQQSARSDLTIPPWKDAKEPVLTKEDKEFKEEVTGIVKNSIPPPPPPISKETVASTSQQGVPPAPPPPPRAPTSTPPPPPPPRR